MRFYTIVASNEVTVDKLESSIAKHVDDLRSNDIKTKVIMKFDTINGAMPTAFNKCILFTHEEIKTELEKLEWTT